MKVGIGLPGAIPGTTPQDLLEWARRADQGPFSTLSIIDRLAYDSYEPMVALGAIAAVTSRVRLMTGILLVPLRNAGMMAKQAATLDVLSGGRLTLGMAIGSRVDDYDASPAPFRNRGKHFDEQLAHMKRVWAGDVLSEGAYAVGPSPVQAGGPEILIGGSAPAALARVGRWADGYITGGGGNPERAKAGFEIALTSWKDNGRKGAPRFVAGLTFAIGQDALERGRANQMRYYSWMGEAAEARAKAIPSTHEAVRDALSALEAIGVDEVVLGPAVADIDQLDRAAELVA